MSYRPTIGLEVHAELKTRTKMFCESANDSDETRPNVNVCPVCMAHPGTLPVINREAVRHILRIGAAVAGTLADYSEFDRKSYFYPDIPKGYQITQYKYPLVVGGTLTGVAITRVHLEEDTARSTHVGGGAGDLLESETLGVERPERSERTAGKSLVDFNRAGIPLMELVTEPVMKDAGAAGRFARELQLLLRTLGAGEANLEKGEMRVEANISVAQEGSGEMGTKVEIKNLNSFRSVERAIEFEIKRQTALIESGGKVVQETRGWNEAKQETFHQRFKEGSADYRYFPEPDLPKLFLAEIAELSPQTIQESLPELPWDRRERYTKRFEIPPEYIEIFLSDRQLGELFDRTVALQPDAYRLVANYICSDIVGLTATLPQARIENITPEGFAALMQGVMQKTVSSRGAKDALMQALTTGEDLTRVMGQYLQQSDKEGLTKVVEAVIAKEVEAVQEYKGGKGAALQYLVGKAMKESGGAGNPSELQKLLEEKLK